MSILTDYYEKYDEYGRLFKDKAHRIEYLTTLKYLNKYIPAKAIVLDCCAGTGTYAFWLAENGFEVTATDLTKKHIDIMKYDKRANMLKDIFQHNALDMSEIADNTFDVVLCMGAYYHIHDSAERNKLITECLRVLKKGGLFVLAYVNRNAIFLNHFKRNSCETLTFDNVIGDGRNDVFYAVDFAEIEALANTYNIEKIANIGVDGSMYILIDEINSLNDAEFKKYMDYHFSVCEEQSIMGNSMHGLYFAKKE